MEPRYSCTAVLGFAFLPAHRCGISRGNYMRVLLQGVFDGSFDAVKAALEARANTNGPPGQATAPIVAWHLRQQCRPGALFSGARVLVGRDLPPWLRKKVDHAGIVGKGARPRFGTKACPGGPFTFAPA